MKVIWKYENQEKEYDLTNIEERIEYGMNVWSGYIKKKSYFYGNKISSQDDFIQEAYLAIVKAAQKFSIEKSKATGGSFRTYCFISIKRHLEKLYEYSTRQNAVNGYYLGNYDVCINEDLAMNTLIDYINIVESMKGNSTINEDFFLHGKRKMQIVRERGLSKSQVFYQLNKNKEIFKRKIKRIL